ncbi:kinase-like domain-containing protein [Mycena galopus ATCC 62051]|nr:kinase-like domain-containing protein [Mycena galopus ATCC 62051]
MSDPSQKTSGYVFFPQRFELPEWDTLGDMEQMWAHLQPRLEAWGYMLRPRYRPGWSLPPGTGPWGSESAIPLYGTGGVLDATRISDGAQVILKFIEPISAETEVARFLANEPGAHEHCVPMLDLLTVDDELSIMVMPRMHDCAKPTFETIGEVVEFIRQVLEGLVFLHCKNIAHRDICTPNIVMDASHMIPGGFHFIHSPLAGDGENVLLPYTGNEHVPNHIKTRTQAAPMRYYFIDFGLSVQFPSYETRRLVTGECGRLRKHLPEISETIPYDPFKVDVRLVGEMLRSEFLQQYVGLDFLIPFVRKLRRRKAAQRPDANEALALFRCHISNLRTEDLKKSITNVNPKEGKKRRAMLFIKGLGFH